MREPEWQKEVEQSLYLQELLPLHPEKSLEQELLRKEPLRSLPLQSVPVSGEESPGEIAARGNGFVLRFPLRQERWPERAPQDGDYTNFGQADACFRDDAETWRGYNRLCFRVRPELQRGQSIFPQDWQFRLQKPGHRFQHGHFQKEEKEPQ